MKVAIYSRVSKESSDNTNQLLILRDYCQKMNYEIYDEYVDVVSGGSPIRPEFNRLMQDASKRKYDMLFFYALRHTYTPESRHNPPADTTLVALLLTNFTFLT